MKLDLKIVKNDRPKPMADEPLKCEARLVWRDAVLSDGTTCDDEMLDKLLKGVDITKYAPPLCLQHDWDVRDVVGKMTDIKLVDGALIAEFDVSDAEAAAKISAGVWDSISLSYELPKCEILECSLVAVPAIPGAKIEPKKAEAEQAPTKDKPEDKTEDKPADTTEDKPAESAPEAEVTEDIELKVKDNACGDGEDKREVENAKKQSDRVVMLERQVEELKAQCKELSDLLVKNDRQAKCEAMQREWIANGKTLPAQKDKELGLMITLDTKQLEAYAQLKTLSAPAVMCGKRLSTPPEMTESREEQLKRGYKEFEARQRGGK